MLEPFDNVGGCVVTSLILMALQDNAFETIKTLEDLKRLMTLAKQPVRLTINPHRMKTPILRGYESRSSCAISDSRALTYDAMLIHLQKLSLAAGFECALMISLL